jgi:hypothetical protein
MNISIFLDINQKQFRCIGCIFLLEYQLKWLESQKTLIVREKNTIKPRDFLLFRKEIYRGELLFYAVS